MFNIIVNVDYINIAINNVGTSITSKSIVGYNQTGQFQGLGFTYQGSPTILYDMGLMVGASGTQVSDNMRGDASNDEDFTSLVNVTGHEPGTVSDFDVEGMFKDNGPTSGSPLNIRVYHRAFAWASAPDEDYIMVQYYIRNNGLLTLNNLFAGLFADWDIPAYAHNKCSTDNSRRMGYIWSTDTGGLYGGIKLLSHTAGFSHYALDNTLNNGGIEMTDGFSNSDKYQSLSTGRANSGIATIEGNDVLSVVSSGPFSVPVGDSIEVAFALIAGKTLAEIQAAADAAQDRYNLSIGIEKIGSAGSDELFNSYPNPVSDVATITFGLGRNAMVDLSIYNMLGEQVKTVISDRLDAGKYSISVDLSALTSGQYYYKLQTPDYSHSIPVSIVR
jgi:hypothetical protein